MNEKGIELFLQSVAVGDYLSLNCQCEENDENYPYEASGQVEKITDISVTVAHDGIKWWVPYEDIIWHSAEVQHLH